MLSAHSISYTGIKNARGTRIDNQLNKIVGRALCRRYYSSRYRSPELGMVWSPSVRPVTLSSTPGAAWQGLIHLGSLLMTPVICIQWRLRIADSGGRWRSTSPSKNKLEFAQASYQSTWSSYLRGWAKIAKLMPSVKSLSSPATTGIVGLAVTPRS